MIKEFSINDFQKCCESFMQTFNSPPWNDKFTIETARIYLQELLDNKRFVGFTSWEDGKLVGFVFCHMRYNWRGDDITIDMMCISPDYQRKGYGSVLLNAVEKFAKENSCVVILLSTSIDAPAFNFYQKLNFTRWESETTMCKSIK